MVLLAFDTATPRVTVAVHDGESVLSGFTAEQPMRHGELLAPSIREVLADAGVSPRDLTRIAVGVGPGPFTGLRVGLVTARTMGAVLDIPVVGVCTLDVVAAAVSVDGPFLVATDARRREVYWARYASPHHRLTAPAVDRPDAVADAGPVAGGGALLYPDAFPRPVEPDHPSATELAWLVCQGSVELLSAEPLYLRRPDVAEPGQRKRVL
jgi:tRNA threonylcarbamoyladenosine biosynthesis protein TsaB